ncbi:MAG TPA: ABC transporter substrate-binding protein [Acidimicrobiales bacterium]|nr:ABC transporter substrate-binding protein [Acidimicrobiales bacterium]
MRTRIAAVASAAAMVLGVTVATSGGPPVGASPSKAPIKIALITSETGAAASLFQTAPQGFLARIALQNAEGGVNGHKLVPVVINDQTSITLVGTAIKEALADGSLGIVSDTPAFFAGYRLAQEAGEPVTGGSFDGPEWGEQPNTNMFAADSGSVDPTYPANTEIGSFLKSHGGTVIGVYGLSALPSSRHAAAAVAESFKKVGGNVGVLDTSINYLGADFTSTALQAKSAGVNTVFAGLSDSEDIALATAFKQAGVKLKAVFLATGYEPGIIGTPAWKEVQGDWFGAACRPFSVPDAGTIAMDAAMRKYEHWSASEFPTLGICESWLGAALMIEGIQRAGANPTQAGVIKALRGITSWNGGGLLAESIDYATVFGHGPPEQCGWYVRAEPKGFVPASTHPVCGHNIPGTGTASPSSS